MASSKLTWKIIVMTANDKVSDLFSVVRGQSKALEEPTCDQA